MKALRLLALVASILCTTLAYAQSEQGREKFPYNATVNTQQVDVRSGPGTTYDVTGRLKQGSQVRVFRHDPGGWYMIAPPEGSFSYIRMEHVRTMDGKNGIVDLPSNPAGPPARAVVRIGSPYTEEANYSGRILSNGETVKIIGRAMVKTDAGQVQMFKIEPPAREYRWVKGDFIIPGEMPTGTVEFGNPSNPIELMPGPSEESNSKDPFGRDLVAQDETEIMVSDQPDSMSTQLQSRFETQKPNPLPAPTRQQLLAEREQLKTLDDRFRGMIADDPGTWQLDELAESYRTLQLQAYSQAMIGMVDQRLAAIVRRQKVLDEWEAFVKLTTETSEREQELLELQAKATVIDADAETVLGPELPATKNTVVASNPKTISSQPKLDGAGILVRSNAILPNAPRYLLQAPDGRVLAYVKAAPGLNLDEFLGKECGLVGQRTYENTLGADLITARRALAIQLKR